ncbi:MAG TPA: lipocalin family protein [Pyrinomonadaceae bacterium]|nr:lipocalin family protein [Pyrinomonadaceae bacterium]HMP64308.1 lipocalin family protein [Pyrinomonadaceae bacterium]
MNLVIVSLIFVFAVPVLSQRNGQDLRAIPDLDLSRYSGRWFEVAKYPNRFQRRCVSDTTATYTTKPNGRFEVVNRCRTGDGSILTAKGEAKTADKTSNSRLKVRFAPGFLSFLPFVWADYWVIGLGEDYQYAVVGEPNRKYFWILSRTPDIDDAKLNEILEQAEKMGFDPSRVERTRHSSALSSDGAGPAQK